MTTCPSPVPAPSPAAPRPFPLPTPRPLLPLRLPCPAPWQPLGCSPEVQGSSGWAGAARGWRFVSTCVQVCPAGAGGVRVRALCHRAFIECLLCVRYVLDTGGERPVVPGRGKTRHREAPLVPEVEIGVKDRPDGAGKVWLQGGWEHPQDIGAWRGQGPLPRVTQAASDRVGAKPGPPDQRAPAVPSPPCLPRPRAWGSTTQYSRHSGRPRGPQPVR